MIHTVKTKPHTDIKRLVWIEKFLPHNLRPYAYLIRIDRPIGIWLLLLPGLWGLTLASDGLPSLYFIALFTLGSVLMRGAGCIINDLWDRDLDKRVERTKSRPLASGAVSAKQALFFLTTLLLLSLLILLQLNKTSIFLGIITLPLIATYPLMKRITWWPQIMLGITFNFSALIGWSAVTGGVDISAFLLYAGALFWTIGYDTIYAHQDKEDDALIGIKSTALKFGKHSKKAIGFFYAAALLCITMASSLSDATATALILLPALHAAWQIKTWEPDNVQSCLRIFKSNALMGLLILITLI